MTWSIKNIENQVSKVEGAYTLTYAIEGMPTIKKHELSVNNGVTYKEITPVGNLTGFSVNVEATSELKNCYIRCTDSEGHSQTSNLFTLQFVSPTQNIPPKIQNIKIQNVNQSGVYQIVYDATDENTNVVLKHYLKIDNEVYKEITPTKVGNTFTYNGVGLSNGTHVCNLKVSDGSLETESTVFQIIIPNIVNNPPTIKDIKVEETSYKGRYRISYIATDIDKTDLITHKLKIDTNGFEVIKPILVENRYVYNGLGLTEGTHEGTIEISDGTNIVKSNPFSIVIKAQEGVGIKQQLASAKVNYDNSYNSLISTVKDVINKMTTDKKYDNSIGANLVDTAFKDYTNKSVLLKDVSQKAIDIIGDKKTSDAKENLAKEISDLTNSLGSLDHSMNDVFKDGILTEAEKITIRQHLQSLSLEKVDVDNQYNSILSKFNKTDLEYAEKGVYPPVTVENTSSKYPDKQWYLKLHNDFKKAYENYSNKYENLILVIDYILKKDGILDSADKDKKDKAFEEYTLAIGEYSKQASLAIEGIGRNETENNECLVQTFKGEYIRTNKENSATLSALTQTTNGLTEQVSQFKQTAEQIQTQVTKNTNGLATQQSTITQLATEIKSAVTEGEFGTLIQQNSNSIVLGLENQGLITSAWLTNGYFSVYNGYVACNKITSLNNDDPYISLFGDKNKGKCAIDATSSYNWGVGDSIRLKWNDSNYIRIANNWFALYLTGGGENALFNVTDDGASYKNNRLWDKYGHINSEAHSHDTLASASTQVRAGTDSSNSGTNWKAFVPVWGGTPLGHAGTRSNKWSVVVADKGTISTSDRKMKENISYIDSPNSSTFAMTEDKLGSGNIYNSKPYITSDDLYSFVKNDLHLATYNYIDNQVYTANQEKDMTMADADYQLGFIAQDIANTKVGQYITFSTDTIMDTDVDARANTEPKTEKMLYVVQNNYINTLAGALQVAINKIETLETEINTLKGNNGGTI